MSDFNDFNPAIPDFVAEAEAAMAAGETFAPEERTRTVRTSYANGA